MQKQHPHKVDISHSDIAILGGGLSGLTAYYLLKKAGRDVHLFEASHRWGGRITSIAPTKAEPHLGDLGPTWVWPDFQPIIARWLNHLKLQTYPQHHEGKAVLDLSPESTPRQEFMPHQQGSTRILGGPQALIDGLLISTEPETAHLECQINAVKENGDGLEVTYSRDGTEHRFTCNKLIVAAPLRLMAESIDWSTLLDPSTLGVMTATPTWMSTQAKATLVYEQPFWRPKGLSGAVFSRVGPLVEIHDHCGLGGSPAALFGFVGIPPKARDSRNLKEAIIKQLVRCFGNEAANFAAFEIKDWATDYFICSQYDLNTQPAHPEVLADFIREPHSVGKVIFAVAETALVSPGLIEGALDAGERAANLCLE